MSTKSTRIADIFAERLNSKLAALGLSQSDLARDLGTSRTTINSWTVGRNIPRADVLSSVADTLQTSADYLVGKTDEEKATEEDDMTFNDRVEEMLAAIMSQGGYDTRKEALAALIREKAGSLPSPPETKELSPHEIAMQRHEERMAEHDRKIAEMRNKVSGDDESHLGDLGAPENS